jgi:hypothetical protein
LASQREQIENFLEQYDIQHVFNIRKSNLTPQTQHGAIEKGLEGASSGLLHDVSLSQIVLQKNRWMTRAADWALVDNKNL